LTGEGTSGSSGEDGENVGEDDKEYKNLDLEKISKDFEQFQEGIKALDAEEEVKTNAADLMRAISVLVSQSKYLPVSDKFVTKYQNVNVLVGPQASVDVLKAKIDELNTKIGGDYEKVDRIQAV